MAGLWPTIRAQAKVPYTCLITSGDLCEPTKASFSLAQQAILGSQTTMSIDKRSGQRQEMEGIIWEVFLGFGSV